MSAIKDNKSNVDGGKKETSLENSSTANLNTPVKFSINYNILNETSPNLNNPGSIDSGTYEEGVLNSSTPIKFSIGYILNEASPHLNNPGSIDRETCEKGFFNKSRRLFHESRYPARDNINPYNQNQFGVNTVKETMKTCSLDESREWKRRFKQRMLNSFTTSFQSEHIHSDCSGEQLLKNEASKEVQKYDIELKYPFKCNDCPRRFREKCVLNRHAVAIHEAKARFICSECQHGFWFKSQLKRHIIVHETSSEVIHQFKCDKCPKGFATLERLKFHNVSSHSAAAKFICSICEKSFLYKSHFERHMVVHLTFKGFTKLECSNCHNVSFHNAAGKFILSVPTCHICNVKNSDHSPIHHVCNASFMDFN